MKIESKEGRKGLAFGAGFFPWPDYKTGWKTKARRYGYTFSASFCLIRSLGMKGLDAYRTLVRKRQKIN